MGISRDLLHVLAPCRSLSWESTFVGSDVLVIHIVNIDRDVVSSAIREQSWQHSGST